LKQAETFAKIWLSPPRSGWLRTIQRLKLCLSVILNFVKYSIHSESVHAAIRWNPGVGSGVVGAGSGTGSGVVGVGSGTGSGVSGVGSGTGSGVVGVGSGTGSGVVGVGVGLD
jgi:hypothetical protein